MTGIGLQHYSIGIDPGLSGAIVVVQRNILRQGDNVVVSVFDLADAVPERGVYLNPVLVSDFLRRWLPYASNVVIEDVSVQTGAEGRVVMFKFGWVKGMLSGIIAGLDGSIAVHYLKPAVWKGNMGLGRDKNESRRLAKKLFPHDGELFRLKKHADRAEAALLGLCGLRLIGLRQG